MEVGLWCGVSFLEYGHKGVVRHVPVAAVAAVVVTVTSRLLFSPYSLAWLLAHGVVALGGRLGRTARYRSRNRKETDKMYK